MLNIRIALTAFAAVLALAGAASAQTSQTNMSGMSGMASAASGTDSANNAEFTEGEIRKVDKDMKKLTIKHGPLKNLDMPGMTMVFAVQDEAVLDKLQTGEKVRFQAEKIDGKIAVTKIEAAH
ncbi:Cation efflux system protein CusF precursor (plasmid) [Variovorax sp. RA8]|nr:copper-binding protein [Variovorax sp. RA8]VTU44466.1 Cation efflux system protein CusF precursor [Variovorax sp. RA8]